MISVSWSSLKYLNIWSIRTLSVILKWLWRYWWNNFLVILSFPRPCSSCSKNTETIIANTLRIIQLLIHRHGEAFLFLCLTIWSSLEFFQLFSFLIMLLQPCFQVQFKIQNISQHGVWKNALLLPLNNHFNQFSKMHFESVQKQKFINKQSIPWSRIYQKQAKWGFK